MKLSSILHKSICHSPVRMMLIAMMCFGPLVLEGCNSELVPSPELESIENSSSGTSSRSIAAPENLSATQGAKQKIVLSWTAVNKAVRYYIYAASTPFEDYVKVGETKKSSFEYIAAAGLTRYFKVSAVSYDGSESDVSSVCKGTTLACPVISDIVLPTELEDSSATIYWYMENADAYAPYLIYVVTCYNGSTVVCTGTMKGAADDGTVTDTAYTFSNLSQNTSYKYTVEAYLTTAQTDSETSDAVDYATAVSLKPKKPENVSATEGTYKDKIEISFVLPEKAYIKQTSSSGTSSSADTYIQYPLYFKIYRRVAVEDGGTENDWSDPMAVLYYSSNGTGCCTTTAPGSTELYGYDVGKTITYTDTATLQRGVKYEYKVQSFVFEKNTTSDISSYATSSGWEAAVPALRLGAYTVTDNSSVDTSGNVVNATYNISATLKFISSWASLGKEGDYKYIVKASRSVAYAEDTVTDPVYTMYDSLSALNNATTVFTICNENGVPDKAVRGYYTFSLYIVPSESAAASSSAETAALDSVKATGTVLVTNEVSLPTFAGFSVTNGYKDKVILSWTKEAEADGTTPYTYELQRYALDEEGNQDGVLATVSTDLSSTAVGAVYTVTDSGLATGTDYVYTLYATTSSNLRVPSDSLTAETLGTASPAFDSSASKYDEIAVTWKPVKQAASYGVNLKNGTAAIVSDTVSLETDSKGNESYQVHDASGADSTDAITLDSDGNLIFTIAKPAGYNDATIAGTNMTLEVSSSSVADGAVRDTTTGNVSVCTLGPCAESTTATVAKSTSAVSVTWKAVAGAGAYLVRRDRCNSSNNKINSTDFYIVPANPTGSTSEIKANNETVSAAKASLVAGVIVFTDTYAAQPSGSTVTTWQKNQDMLSWGYPYRYTVFPLENAGDTYDAVSESSVTVGDVTYKNTDKLYATGSTIGYGVDVRATKSEDPNKVTVTWTKPYLGSASVDPVLWRSVDGKNVWEETSDDIDSTGVFIVSPTGTERTNAYDYAVVYNGETPHSTYLSAMTSTLDDTYSPTEPLNKGYPFAIAATAVNVPTSGEVGYSEKVGWTLWNYDDRAIGPATSASYTVAVKNANFASGWQSIATVDKDGNISTNKLDSYLVDMATSGQSITLTPTGMSDSAINTGLLRVLRDYKHYYEVVLTRTNSEGTSITASYADGALYAYRKISNAEFAKSAMLAITYGFYMAQTGDDTDYSSIGSESAIYDAKSTSGLSGTFSYTKGTIVWKIGIVPYKHSFTFGSYVPAQLAESGESVAFMKISSSAQEFYRYELTAGWFDLFNTSPCNFTVSCYDSTMSEYSGTLAVTCSGPSSFSVAVTRSNGSSSTFSATTSDGVHTWFPIRFHSDSKYYIKDSTYGWW